MMNGKCSAVAVSALALGVVCVAATDASAREAPEPQHATTTPQPKQSKYDPPHHGNMTPATPHRPEYNHPEYKLDVPTSVAPPTDSTDASGDGTEAEAWRAGTYAFGGAGLAFGGLWLYLRRRVAF